MERDLFIARLGKRFRQIVLTTFSRALRASPLSAFELRVHQFRASPHQPL